jgi:hypothetical protein
VRVKESTTVPVLRTRTVAVVVEPGTTATDDCSINAPTVM